MVEPYLSKRLDVYMLNLKIAGRKKQMEARKAAVATQQSRGSLVPLKKAGQRRKPMGDGGYPTKKPSNQVDCWDQVETIQKTLGPLRHGKGKGLMTSYGPNVNPPIPLLVKNKEYTMGRAQSFVENEDLEEFSEDETEPLAMQSKTPLLFQALVRMRALKLRCDSKEVDVDRLRAHRATDAKRIVQFKEAVRTLNAKLKA
ncbi:hypothetical protein SO802_013029 [Lithocarpus litseifolius]|uniref:Uncharacterized protein n=1 Tax=Lithocarpus litseifolius TaxID=425828 RepID=A0AAW2D734_9ROSI